MEARTRLVSIFCDNALLRENDVLGGQMLFLTTMIYLLCIDLRHVYSDNLKIDSNTIILHFLRRHLIIGGWGIMRPNTIFYHNCVSYIPRYTLSFFLLLRNRP